MARTFIVAAFATLAACASPQTLAPGPGPTTPHFADENHWVASDGYVLGLSQWQAKDPGIVIVALHGMNDYGRFIDSAAKYWQSHGITTYAYDQRGFGRTEGNGRWPGHDVMAKDARAFVALAHTRHPKARVILLGESMGGAVAMVAAAQSAEPVADALVLVSPALWGWSNLDVFKRSALWLAMQIAPGGHLSGRGLNIKPSDNEQMLLALGRDPYVIKSTRVDALYGLADLMEAAWLSAPAVTLPTMVLYATGDQVVPSEPIRDATAAMPGVAHVVCYADGFHMLLRDLSAQRTWDEIEAFVRRSQPAKEPPPACG